MGAVAMIVWYGLLGMVTASLTAVALRLVRADEVPRYLRSRMRWWGAHNPMLMMISLLATVGGLIGLVAT